MNNIKQLAASLRAIRPHTMREKVSILEDWEKRMAFVQVMKKYFPDYDLTGLRVGPTNDFDDVAFDRAVNKLASDLKKVTGILYSEEGTFQNLMDGEYAFAFTGFDAELGPTELLADAWNTGEDVYIMSEWPLAMCAIGIVDRDEDWWEHAKLKCRWPKDLTQVYYRKVEEGYKVHHTDWEKLAELYKAEGIEYANDAINLVCHTTDNELLDTDWYTDIPGFDMEISIEAIEQLIPICAAAQEILDRWAEGEKSVRKDPTILTRMVALYESCVTWEKMSDEEFKQREQFKHTIATPRFEDTQDDTEEDDFADEEEYEDDDEELE